MLAAGEGHSRPNVLLAISDDQSWPHAGAYGVAAVDTPAFDRVARSGVLFTSAFVASPGCSPSRAALLTGRYPWQLENAGTHASSFPSRYVVFPDILERAGYHVGFTGKGWGPGNWRISGRPRNPAGPEWNRRRARPPAPGIRATDYAANFRDFLEARPDGAPFYFWYGASEPHRVFARGAGVHAGKKLEDAPVPPFLPDTPEVRGDVLDYLVEIEWFDRHLGSMLEILAWAGELENTLVIVTSDNGMAFPRAKANLHEYGIHVPLAISWPRRAHAGRRVDDPVSLVDLAPTILEAAGVRHPGHPPMTGRSLLPILAATPGQEGDGVGAERRAVFAARERHSSSRHRNVGYPCRAIRTRDYLLIRNFARQRWPAGAPTKLRADGSPGPPHDAYHDIDASPTLSLLVERREDPAIAPFFHLAVDRRPEIELYHVARDPGCLENLAESEARAAVRERLAAELEGFLRRTGDPRMGPDGDVFERYARYSRIRRFPPPDRRTPTLKKRTRTRTRSRPRGLWYRSPMTDSDTDS